MLSYPRDVSNELYERLLARRESKWDQLKGTADELKGFHDWHTQVEPIPNKELLGLVLDVAFFASVVQEEGQGTAFSLLYVDPALARKSQWPCVHFENVLPLAVENIRKLSPATDPSMVDIGVFEIDGVLQIWGFIYLRQSQSGSRSLPTGLAVSVRQPGVLVVCQGPDEIMIYAPGRVQFVNTEHYHGSINLRTLVSQALSEEKQFWERLQIASRLVDMASIALEMHHGATFLIVPHDKPVKALDLSKYRADAESRSRLAAVFLDPERAHVGRALARAAFVDGACVLDDEGTFLGFGAMIRTSEADDFEVEVINPVDPTRATTRTSLLRFGGGARHRSSLIFTYLNPGVLAFVVSHDGVMSVMTRPLSEDFVAVVRPYQRGMDLSL